MCFVLDKKWRNQDSFDPLFHPASCKIFEEKKRVFSRIFAPLNHGIFIKLVSYNTLFLPINHGGSSLTTTFRLEKTHKSAPIRLLIVNFPVLRQWNFRRLLFSKASFTCHSENRASWSSKSIVKRTPEAVQHGCFFLVLGLLFYFRFVEFAFTTYDHRLFFCSHLHGKKRNVSVSADDELYMKKALRCWR